jgi:hypothetical protein
MGSKSSVADPLRSTLLDNETGEAEVLISRFDAGRRSCIRQLFKLSPRFADLAVVFPGALHALAGRPVTQKRKHKAVDLVIGGAPLREVAQALELPLWLRRLPPEAFTELRAAPPRSDLFARRIANHLPTSAENSAFWLSSVTFGARASDEYFALWLAQQPVFLEAGEPERLFGLLAAYAWTSNEPRSPAHSLIVVPWRPTMSLETAACSAKSWLNRMRLVLQLRRGAISDPWLEPGEARGFTFHPLLDHTAILEEAHAMQNCADQYGDRLARDKCRLFSVKRRGSRVATLEIGPHPREAGVLAISQLKARHNLPASIDVWQAAHTWLGAQRELKRASNGEIPNRPFDTAAWRDLMASYRAHKDGAPWMPEHACKESFAAIESGIAELARRVGITSWLFT